MASDFAGIEDEAARIIQSLRKRFSSQALSASTLGLVVNGLVITGVVPGGPADKYDHTVPLEKRIEAHDTILTVDGESATEANILRLLRGDGTVGSSAVITVQKFGSPSSLSPRGARDVVQVTLHRDYKWWVEGMRDVAVAVEQVSFDMGGSISDRSNDEGLMHTGVCTYSLCIQRVSVRTCARCSRVMPCMRFMFSLWICQCGRWR